MEMPLKWSMYNSYQYDNGFYTEDLDILTEHNQQWHKQICLKTATLSYIRVNNLKQMRTRRDDCEEPKPTEANKRYG